MTFWGTKLEAGQRLTFSPPPGYTLTVSQACLALDSEKSKNKARNFVYCTYEGKSFAIASLDAKHHPHTRMELIFQSGMEVSFEVRGKDNVDLIGNLAPMMDMGMEDMEDMEDGGIEMTEEQFAQMQAMAGMGEEGEGEESSEEDEEDDEEEPRPGSHERTVNFKKVLTTEEKASPKPASAKKPVSILKTPQRKAKEAAKKESSSEYYSDEEEEEEEEDRLKTPTSKKRTAPSTPQTLPSKKAKKEVATPKQAPASTGKPVKGGKKFSCSCGKEFAQESGRDQHATSKKHPIPK